MVSFIELSITLFALSNLILATSWLLWKSKCVHANYFLAIILGIPIISLLQGLCFRFDIFPTQSGITIFILLFPHFFGHLFAPSLWWYYRKITRQSFSVTPHLAIWIIDIVSLIILLSKSELTQTVAIISTYVGNPLICDLYNVSAVLQLTIYCVVILYKSQQDRKKQEKQGIGTRQKNTFDWIQSLTAVILLIHLLSFPLMFILPQYIIDFGMIQIVYNILAMFIIFYLIKQPILFAKALPHSRRIATDSCPMEESIRLALDTHKLYLEPDFSLQKLADHFNHSISWVSTKAKQEFPDQNLSEVINSYRVNHAKSLLTKDEYAHYSIEAIGNESGFNSRASFFRAFKHHVGLTPALYKKRKEVV